jgi:hypothetical protein
MTSIFDETEPRRTNTDLNTLPEGWTVADATQYGNVLAITGDFLTAEQHAEINAAVSSLTTEQQKRVKEIVGAWLHSHHGQGLPNVKELAKAVKNGSIT